MSIGPIDLAARTMTNGYHHEVDTRSKKEREDKKQAPEAKTTVARTDRQSVSKAAATTTQSFKNQARETVLAAARRVQRQS